MAAVDLIRTAGRVAGFTVGRFLRAKGLSVLTGDPPERFIRDEWSDAATIKAAVGAVGVDSDALATVRADLLDILRPLPILTRLGVEPKPFDLPTLAIVGGGDAAWVPEGAAIAVNGQGVVRIPGLRPHRVGAIDVLTRESLLGPLRFDQFIGRNLAIRVARALDRAFIDPANDGSDHAPAAITAPSSDLPSVSASGDAVADIAALLALYEGDLLAARFVMHPITAVEIGAAFEDATDTRLGVAGGVLCGIPVIASQSVPRDSSGSVVTLVDTSALDIALAVEDIDVSVEGTIIMDDAPVMDSTTPTGGTTMVSLWQTNSVALKAYALADWQVKRSGAVAVLTGAAYGAS